MAPDTSEIPSECPENRNNCERLMMAVNASPEALHSAAMEWISTQSRTSIESEEATSSHSVFHSRWFMFPDDFSSKQDALKMELGFKFTQNHEWGGATWV